MVIGRPHELDLSESPKAISLDDDPISEPTSDPSRAHQRPVLGKGVRKETGIAVLLGTGHNL